MFIYKIINKQDSKVYVGQTTDTVSNRFEQHLRLLKRNKHPNRHLQFAFNKYGNVFIVETVQTASSRAELDSMEIFWIAELQTRDNSIGYNLAVGGKGSRGFKHRDESKKKIGEASALRGGGKLGAPKLKDKVRPQEVRKKISASNMGKKRTKQTCQNISQAKKGIPNQKKRKPVVDSLGNRFDSIKDAAKYYGVCHGTIDSVLSGRTKKMKFNITFRYVNSEG